MLQDLVRRKHKGSTSEIVKLRVSRVAEGAKPSLAFTSSEPRKIRAQRFEGLQPTNMRVEKGTCARTYGSQLLKDLTGSQISRFDLRRIRTILRGSWPEGQGSVASACESNLSPKTLPYH
jgi:hypothetical protein